MLLKDTLKAVVLVGSLCVIVVSPTLVAGEALIIGGNVAYDEPPHSWVDSCSGQITGANRVVLERAFTKAGVAITFDKPIPVSESAYRTVISQINNGEVDALKALPRISLGSDFLFSNEPVAMIKESIVFLKKHKSKFSEDLANVSGLNGVAMELGENRQQLIKKYGWNVAVYQGNDKHQLITQLELGNYDYIIMGTHKFHLLQRDFIKNDSLQSIEIHDFYREFYFVVKKESTAARYLPLIDKELKAMRDSGFIDFIQNKYLQIWINKKTCGNND
ncbi:ABC transporter substrate-binding protein [Oceanicoccus sp. KOV_DT_Chl]|uniref:substrate-binding periplasmic protein n=1 Tax=Oceanicoccus sp. KOV_DT_Chl TaxID=1904639 RepID=UPI00135877E7|nr:transporter substrate-binding domain-containing protein [Oceanicoccus sp. KOV_DT_Chl]